LSPSPPGRLFLQLLGKVVRSLRFVLILSYYNLMAERGRALDQVRLAVSSGFFNGEFLQEIKSSILVVVTQVHGRNIEMQEIRDYICYEETWWSVFSDRIQFYDPMDRPEPGLCTRLELQKHVRDMPWIPSAKMLLCNFMVEPQSKTN
jgi:hypothetical protein